MVPGPSVNLHHLVPRSHGGRDSEAVHRVCHNKIHAELSEKELAQSYRSWEALRGHPEIARFICWVRRKHPEFIDWNKSPRK